MVSLRRKKLLELRAGRIPALDTCRIPVHNGNIAEKESVPKVESGSSNASACSSLKEQDSIADPPIKRRKLHRRKRFQSEEQWLMRGVYYKNMKWQAAIKVDKKQIHLGTVGSQVEAARLYDRAAFMCGREPNFEIPEQEKMELRKFKWDEFLALTRSEINNKKSKRRGGMVSKKKRSDSFSASDN